MRNGKLTAFAAPIILLLIGAYVPSQAATPCPLDLGHSAPRLAGSDLSGQPRTLADYAGRWVYIDFWATWCQPCMHKLPGVVQLHQEASQLPDFEVLSVSLDDSGAEAGIQDVATEYGIGFPVIYEGKGWYSSNAMEWCVDSIPATFLVDPAGRLVARDIEPQQALQLVQQAGSQAYTPIRVATRERLLNDSPSSGRSEFSDLQIAVDRLPESSRIRRYKLEAYYAFSDGSSAIAAQTAGYEIEVRQGSGGPDSPPYALLIAPADVSFSDREWRNTPFIAAAGQRPASWPGLSATIDASGSSCEFTLPLPRQCASIAYSLCFYDETMQRYVCNGIRLMVNPR